MSDKPDEWLRKRIHILQIEPVRQLGLQRDDEARHPRRVHEIWGDEDDQERTVIQREYPQHSPSIEDAEVVRRALRVVENPCDEEAREHEEKIDAAPPEEKRPLQN